MSGRFLNKELLSVHGYTKVLFSTTEFFASPPNSVLRRCQAAEDCVAPAISFGQCSKQLNSKAIISYAWCLASRPHESIFLPCIWEGCRSNLGMDTEYLNDIFVVFLNPSGQLPGK